MHEFSLCRRLLRLIDAQRRRHRLGRIRAVHLDVGALTNIDPLALETAFRLLSRGTPLEDSRLHLHRRPGRGRCPRCATTHDVHRRPAFCPHCAAPLQVEGGDRLTLSRLEHA